MSEKISTLVLKVDLDCPQCFKKIKKILSKFSSDIQNQVIDEKQNTVTISGPFDPKCFSKKLCCKGGKTIKSIEIVKPDPPKPPAAKQSEPAPAPAPKQPEPAPKEPAPKAKEPEPAAKEPKPTPKEPAPAPKEPAPKQPEPKQPEPKQPEPAPKPKQPEPAPKPKQPEPVYVPITFEPVPEYPPVFGGCCGQGYGGGPCYHGYGNGEPAHRPCYGGGAGGGYGRTNKVCYVSSDYFSEENPNGCTIM